MNTRRLLASCAMTATLLFTAGVNALPESPAGNHACQGANCGIETAGTDSRRESHATPDPTTIAMLAIGLIGLGLARRRAN